MPFIVTTKRPIDAVDCGHPDAPDDGHWTVRRWAGATLADAHAEILLDPSNDSSLILPEYIALRKRVLALPESGGSVGPLPDGTVIEVSQGPGQQDMRQQLREWGFWMDTRDALDSTIEVAWTSAYNAREAGHA